VDNGDFGKVFANFGTFAVGSLVDNPDRPDLIYDPATGEVILDPTEANGGVVTNFVLQNTTGSFIPANFVPIFNNFTTTATVNELSETDLLAAGFSVATSIGNVFPTGLSLQGLHDLLSTATYVGALGTGEFEWDLYIPEPASFAMLMLGGLALIRRRR
jgi:hypothetical protein